MRRRWARGLAPRTDSDTIRYVSDPRPNLADPDYEPSDEELAGLAKRAFAGLKDAELARVEKLRSDVARARAEALALLAEAGSTR